MAYLDAIKRKQLLSSPETVTSDWVTPSVSLDDREGEFSLALKYENGSSVEMNIYIQLSVDNENFGDVEDEFGNKIVVQVSDTSGVVVFDMSGSGALYTRIRVEPVTGSIDVVEVKYTARQRH